MRTIIRRIAKLENRFGTAGGKAGILVVVTRAGWGLALDKDTCVLILRRYGFLPPSNSGVNVVDLGQVPFNLSAEELKRFLRENGAKLCGPRTPGGEYGRTTAEANR
jgi:hypothetical protein